LRYQYITTTFLTPQDLKKNSPVLKKLYKNYSLHEIPIEKARKEIEDKGITKSDFSSIFGRVRVFTVGNKYYIYVQRVNFVLYIMVIKKLSPLKKLNKQIEQFAGGDMNVKINHNGDDEIARIAKSFDKAIAHIRQLISSKNLFMRNIMHELKTPITTSRIVADTVEDEMAKGILIRSFDRMNELIEDLADVERVTMYNFAPEKDEWLLSEIFKETKKMLIKYSPNHFASITVIGNKIAIKSKGEKLKQDLNYYTEPFSQEEKRSAGFGLGLYIVANVSEKLGYDFRYRYNKENQENIFELVID